MQRRGWPRSFARCLNSGQPTLLLAPPDRPHPHPDFSLRKSDPPTLTHPYPIGKPCRLEHSDPELAWAGGPRGRPLLTGHWLRQREEDAAGGVGWGEKGGHVPCSVGGWVDGAANQPASCGPGPARADEYASASAAGVRKLSASDLRECVHPASGLLVLLSPELAPTCSLCHLLLMPPDGRRW